MHTQSIYSLHQIYIEVLFFFQKIIKVQLRIAMARIARWFVTLNVEKMNFFVLEQMMREVAKHQIYALLKVWALMENHVQDFVLFLAQKMRCNVQNLQMKIRVLRHLIA